MKMLDKFLAIFCAAALCGGTATASVVFDQPAGVGSNTARISSTLDNFGGSPGYRVADNFSLAGGAIITDVHWWGTSPSSPINPNFTFTFYSNDNGSPGAVILSTTGTLTTATVSPGSGFDPLQFYSSDLADPFTASAGSTYWLSIFDSTADERWLWASATSTGDGSYQRQNDSTSWAFPTVDMSFQLTSSVPEPGTLALLGFGLAGLAVSRRRKQ